VAQRKTALVKPDSTAEFVCPDCNSTRIHKQASVRRVDGCAVGAEFTAGSKAVPLDPRYDLALAQYDPSAESS
jgi:hypothetical protein